MFLMSLSNVYASFTDEWGEYQDDYSNTGFVSDETGIWTQQGTRTSISDGSQFQPISIDIDNDGTIELIGSDGNFLKIWYLNNDVLTLKDELNFGSTQTVQMITLDYDLNNNSLPEIITVFGTNMSVLEYNGTNFLINNSISLGATVRTGLRCTNPSGTSPICFWGNSDGNISRYVPVLQTLVDYNVSAGDIFHTEEGERTSPPREDIDRDNQDELVLGCDWDLDGNEGICVWDTSSLILDTGFSSDGIIDNFNTLANDAQINGIMIYNLDGGGDLEIIVNDYQDGGFAAEDTYFQAFNSDGSVFISRTLVYDNGGADAGRVSPLVIQNFLGTDDYEICMISTKESTTSDISCYSLLGSKVFEYTTSAVAGNDDLYWRHAGSISSANMDGDFYFEMVSGGTIINLNLDNTTTDINVSSSRTSDTLASINLVDLNGDNNLDVCGIYTNNVFCSLSLDENQPPTLNNVDYQYGGYGNDIGFGNPVCVNTTLTFSAQETGGVVDGNYDNDLSEDTERIVSNCGFNSNPTLERTNGTYDLSTPTFSCFYNSTGIYSVRLYLQDNANDEDFSQYNTQTITVQVINGISGSTCNVIDPDSPASLEDEEVLAGQDDVTDSIGSVVNLFTGANEIVKLIIGITFIIAAMIGVFMSTKSNWISIGAGMLTMFVLTFIGFFPIWIVIITLLGIGGLAVLSFNRNQGGT